LKPEGKDNRRVAVIDLGSNTFHLIIAAVSGLDKSYEIIKRKRIYAYLSRDGIEHLADNTIKECIEHFGELHNICEAHQVTEIRAIGTSALRAASNAHVFLAAVYNKFGLRIDVIDGVRESELIYKGLSQSDIDHDQVNLMMDIGGGSVEFILCHRYAVLFSESYDIGISVIKNKYRSTDPISQDEKYTLHDWLNHKLPKFLAACADYKPNVLVGASGPFEIMESYCGLASRPHGNKISMSDALQVVDEVTNRKLSERLELSYMPEDRADLSRESMLQLEYIFDKVTSLEGLIVSPYSLKEGLLSEII